jgi:transposase
MALAAGTALFTSSMTAGSRSISNVVERAIRSIALNRKNALFAGSDGGGEHWAILATLIETSKLNGIDPQAYLADVLAHVARGHTINRLDRLLPWKWKTG